MDTSKEYIEMCRQAERDAPELFYKSSFNIHDFTFKVEGNDLLWWLPRQDDLQEMISLASHQHPQDLLRIFYEWVQHHDFKWIHFYASMEQLWLAFVMKEKYNKIWDGKWNEV